MADKAETERTILGRTCRFRVAAVLTAEMAEIPAVPYSWGDVKPDL